MIRPFRFALIAGLFLVFALSNLVRAQEPVVYGVMFYSPGCPHCREVLENHWPQIQAEFGDQLRVLFINIDDSFGQQVLRDAVEALGIDSPGVPMLIIGSQVMTGSVTIPQYASAVIQAGLDAGGVPLPAIPGIEDLYQTAVEQYEQAQAADSADVAEDASSPTTTETVSIAERLAADPVANALAMFILALLVSSLAVVVVTGWQNRIRHPARWLMAMRGRMSRIVLVLLALLGLAMTLSLMLGWNQDSAILLLASGELLVFLVSLILVSRTPSTQPLSTWLVPLVAFAGLIVAGYLAYVEVTLSDAVCGALGNCNTVQQSPYARILNIPVGILGIAGYTAIVLVWLFGRGRQDWPNQMLRAIVVVGVGFSSYLTFLEPFVIGASCVWCLTSALLMLMLLWIINAPEFKSPVARSELDSLLP